MPRAAPLRLRLRARGHDRHSCGDEGRARPAALSLQDAIERFEPRLARPRVRLIDAQQVRAPQIRFVVEAVLVMDPGREDVVFDTVLEIASGEYDVHDADATSAG